MGDVKRDLDHKQDETDSLVKSVKPNNDFMKSEGLCTRCHGKRVICALKDCPQKVD